MNYNLQLSAQYLKQGHVARRTTDTLATKTKRIWIVSGKDHCIQMETQCTTMSTFKLASISPGKDELPTHSLHTVCP